MASLSPELSQTLDRFAKTIADGLGGDDLSLPDFAARIDQALPFFQNGFSPRLAEVWEERNKSLPLEKSRPYDHPLLLLRGHGEGAPEERIRALIPEEKILINRQVFHNLLDGIPIDKLDPAREKGLLGMLKTESIGLSDQEVFIYYTLIKLSRAPVAAKGESGAALTPVDASRIVLDSLGKAFGDLAGLTALNENHEMPRELLTNLYADRLRQRKPAQQVALFLSGAFPANPHPTQVVKAFLGMMAEKWGADVAECLLLYNAYFILGGMDPSIARATRTMASFVRGESTRLLKPVLSVSIQFIHAFSQTLAMQVVEINRKYHGAPADQQQKIAKLYAAPDRRLLLLTNATTHGYSAIASSKSEAMEIAKIWKALGPKIPGYLTPDDLFGPDYHQPPVRET